LRPLLHPEGWTNQPREGPTGACLTISHFRRLPKDESGATAIEYGLIAAGLSIAITTVVNGLGTKLNTKFTSISTQLT
jgi:pilus assembly protein Flp/PilA